MFLSKFRAFAVVCVVFCAFTAVQAESLWDRETLTEGFFGLNEELEDSGIQFGLGLTQVYQANVRGGLSTHRRAGRYAGSADLKLKIDLEKLWGLEGARFYVGADGSWSDGINGPSVGGFFDVNDDAAGNESFYVDEFWYQQAFRDDTFFVRLGKIDLTNGFDCGDAPGTFDGNRYANDEKTQFLNSALDNNPAIPLPSKSIGVTVFYNPSDTWYVGAAMADASPEHKSRHSGFNTAFDGSKDYFYIVESGITPVFESAKGGLPGGYRLGAWYDPRPKGHSGAASRETGDMGFYTSLDQMVWKENDDPKDSQGIGGFFRYGYADPKKNDLSQFWSLGFQYEGLVDGRDADVFGFGYAHGVFSNGASGVYTDDHEGVYEVYYNIYLTAWASLSPIVQYVNNPGGDQTVDDAVVMGLRAQIAF